MPRTEEEIKQQYLIAVGIQWFLISCVLVSVIFKSLYFGVSFGIILAFSIAYKLMWYVKLHNFDKKEKESLM